MCNGINVCWWAVTQYPSSGGHTYHHCAGKTLYVSWPLNLYNKLYIHYIQRFSFYTSSGANGTWGFSCPEMIGNPIPFACLVTYILNPQGTVHNHNLYTRCPKKQPLANLTAIRSEMTHFYQTVFMYLLFTGLQNLHHTSSTTSSRFTGESITEGSIWGCKMVHMSR